MFIFLLYKEFFLRLDVQVKKTANKSHGQTNRSAKQHSRTSFDVSNRTKSTTKSKDDWLNFHIVKNKIIHIYRFSDGNETHSSKNNQSQTLSQSFERDSSSSAIEASQVCATNASTREKTSSRKNFL